MSLTSTSVKYFSYTLKSNTCMENLDMSIDTLGFFFFNRGSKLAMLMQDSLGNVNCHTTIVAHVSTSHEDLSETLCTIQIVSRIRRLQRIRVCLLSFYEI